MYTSVLIIALTGLVAEVDQGSSRPDWSTEYTMARRLAIRQDKPLAVFLGGGKAGWDRVSLEGKLSAEVRARLASDYICVHVDTDRDPGKGLADQFELPAGTGLVLSDRSATKQAFWHQGVLSNKDLVRCLEKYADGREEVRSTETLEAILPTSGASERIVTTSRSSPISLDTNSPVLSAQSPSYAPQAAAPLYQPVPAFQPGIPAAPSFSPSFVPAAAGRGC